MLMIQIPEGVSVDIGEGVIKIKGKLGENSRKFNPHQITVKKDGNNLVIDHIQNKKLEKKLSIIEYALYKELMSDIHGVNEYYNIKMQLVYAHFPVTLEIKEKKLYIKNLFGERTPRVAKIQGNTKVEIKAQDVNLSGTSLEDVSQTAANIRKACVAKDKDTRIFQDGIYFVE
ncbi:MAG: 50S ribosomal protein L6 [Candidatus Micrarchaeia archaeon]